MASKPAITALWQRLHDPTTTDEERIVVLADFITVSEHMARLEVASWAEAHVPDEQVQHMRTFVDERNALVRDLLGLEPPATP